MPTGASPCGIVRNNFGPGVLGACSALGHNHLMELYFWMCLSVKMKGAVFKVPIGFRASNKPWTPNKPSAKYKQPRTPKAAHTRGGSKNGAAFMNMYTGNMINRSSNSPKRIGAIVRKLPAAKPSLPAVFRCFCHWASGTSCL